MAAFLGESLFSLLFRAAIFAFLRIIPTPLGQVIIPTLFIAWLSTTWLSAAYDPIDDSNPRARRSSALTTILFSLPTPSRSLRRINFAINCILLVAAIDFVAYPFFDSAEDVTFTRVGAVYHDAVKLVVRHPINESDTDTLPVHVVWREQKSHFTNWTTGPELNLTSENDWLDTVELKGLWPHTKYEYRLSSNDSAILPYPPAPIKFRTFPDPQLGSGSRFKFAVTSCLTPNFPYVPMQGRRIKGFSLLADYLAQIAGPKSSPMEFLLFLGDFIYADVPVYIGDTKEAYRRLYRRNYQSPDFRKVYESLPIFHAYDDHEIKNNFEGKSNDSSPPYPSASDAFKIYNSNANYHSHGSDEHYYEFRYADVAFFVMDTRRYRSGVNGTVDTVEVPTMLGEKQLTELFAWLGRVNSTATFKFIVTSVPFTSLWGHDAQVDSWAGYPAEKAALLKVIHTVPNVIFLSGDRHEFAAIEFNAEEGYPVYEFSTSPLSMFYIPFFRTLAPESLERVRRGRQVVEGEEGVEGGESTTVVEEVPQERVLKYLPSGNHKWAVFDLNTKNPDSPVLKIEVMIDGQPQYSHEIIGEPVVLPTGTAIGLLSSVQHLLGKFRTDPRKWF